MQYFSVGIYPWGVYTEGEGEVMKAHKVVHGEHLNRLARVEGQIRGIRRMIEERAYCVDIIIQVQAAEAALAALRGEILAKHMRNCVAEAFDGASHVLARQRVDELLNVMGLGGRGKRKP